ncbi:putative gustatory receptor 28b [Chrysoperla carnea]|uniref:putative gustatory receptor 28b n=1 Tax=Chrysoperla carnea TaxID=189513 RepID=UPI001D067B96|nr:putative gustatory receptor 28b [Chrysoperla carnea]
MTQFENQLIHKQAINEKLLAIYETQNHHKPKVIRQNWAQLTTPIPSGGTSSIDIKTFIILRQLYDRLCDNSRQLNRAFSLQLLFTFGNAFVVIFCSVYGCLFGYVVNGQITDRTNIKYFFLPFVVLSVAILKLLLMVFSCENMVGESRLTGSIIQKISLTTQQRQIKDMVQEFSLQLMHQSISITAFGFFNVDCTLLQTIVGAVTTYLIILIQFDLTMTHGDNLLNSQQSTT